MKVEITDEKLAKRLIVNGVAKKVITAGKPEQPDYKGRLMSFFLNGKLVRIGIAHNQDEDGDWLTEESDFLTDKDCGNCQTFISPDGWWSNDKLSSELIKASLPLTTLEMAKKYGEEWNG